MPKTLSSTELILDSEGRIYHLHLKPENLADTIILVGDPSRVTEISQCFDSIEFRTQEREFVTVTGYIGTKKLSVISTGISTANVDIVLNELDALVNIDFKTRQVKTEHTALTLIRLGTSGSLQEDIPSDSFLVSSHGVSLNSLFAFYDTKGLQDEILLNAFIEQTSFEKKGLQAHLFEADKKLLSVFSKKAKQGITVTCSGFYGPQERYLRTKNIYPRLIEELNEFQFEGKKITNFEMETAALYGLGKILGHHCISISAIVGNRINHQFSSNPKATIDKLIRYVLEIIT